MSDFMLGSYVERIFSLVGSLTNLRECHLQMDNFFKMKFVNKN
jgi:mRNA-degrading endonuclease YafQ of YafQ-DinJ toxin-antitoxin module